MRLLHRIAAAAILASLVGQYPRPVLAQQTADDVLRKVDDLQRNGGSESSSVEMRLFDGDREIRRRQLTILSATDTAGRTSALVEFTHPPDIRGTRLLTLQTNSGDQQSIFLPALRRVQRIAGSTREDRFAGSDLSYEDLRVREWKDYASTIVDSNETKWTIESIPKDRDSPYGRILVEVDKGMYAIVGAKYFDKKGTLLKVLEATEFQNLGKRGWRASRLTMKNVRSNGRTEFVYLERDLEAKVSPDVFTDRYLRRGVQ